MRRVPPITTTARSLSLALAVTASFALAACHSQPAGGAAGRSVRNVITQAEIDSSDASNVYDLIARTRGEFLKDRGATSIKMNTHARAVVFMNDHEYGILETLRNIPRNRIGEIRYYPGIEAVAKYGSQYGGGVVLLLSRVE